MCGAQQVFGGGGFPDKRERAGLEGPLHAFVPRIRADEDDRHR